MIDDLHKVESKVNYLLSKYPQTRDSDKMLWLAYNVKFNSLKESIGKDAYLAFRKWLLSKETPVFESLSRARRKVQARDKDLEGDKNKRLAEADQVKTWSRH